MTRTYDLVMTHKLDADDFFIHRVQQHCAERGLNSFLVNHQCHMLTQTANPAIGVPDDIVAGIARRLVEGAQEWVIPSR